MFDQSIQIRIFFVITERGSTYLGKRNASRMVLISNVDDGHWTEIYEHLWGQIHQSSTFQSESQPYNQTGANVQICCSDGKAIFHVDRLLQFTNLLDFALEEENLDHHQDPFGNMTILTPHLQLESVNALGRLIYCGETGQLKKNKRCRTRDNFYFGMSLFVN